MNTLEIYMLGNLRILLNGKPVLGKMSSKAAALLCYLAINRNKAFSREKLSSIFWESAASETARYNLRYTLWTLRKLFNAEKKQPEVILTEKDSCFINPELKITVDALDMENLAISLQRDNSIEPVQLLETIKGLYKGDFLEGFYINKSVEFNDWVFYERERLQRIYFEALSCISKLHIEAGDYRGSIQLLNDMLRINPLQEELYEALIRNYLELGDRNAALSQYRRCSDILREELNISPNESIDTLYRQIKFNDQPVSSTSDKKVLQYEPSGLKLIIYSDSLPGESELMQPRQDILTVYASCLPVIELQYGCLSDLIRAILRWCPQHILKELPKCFWRDLYRIEAGALDFTGEAFTVDQLTALSEKIRIFAALERLFNTIAERISFTVHIQSVQWIDKLSMEFFRYFLFRNHDVPMTVVFSGMVQEELAADLRQHFPIKYNKK